VVEKYGSEAVVVVVVCLLWFSVLFVTFLRIHCKRPERGVEGHD